MKKYFWKFLFVAGLLGVVVAGYFFRENIFPRVSYVDRSTDILVERIDSKQIEKFAKEIGIFNKTLRKEKNGIVLGSGWRNLKVLFVDKVGTEGVLKWGEAENGFIDAISIMIEPDVKSKTLITSIYVNPNMKNIWDKEFMNKMVSNIFRNRLYEMVYSGNDLKEVLHRDIKNELDLFSLSYK